MSETEDEIENSVGSEEEFINSKHSFESIPDSDEEYEVNSSKYFPDKNNLDSDEDSEVEPGRRYMKKDCKKISIHWDNTDSGDNFASASSVAEKKSKDDNSIIGSYKKMPSNKSPIINDTDSEDDIDTSIIGRYKKMQSDKSPIIDDTDPEDDIATSILGPYKKMHSNKSPIIDDTDSEDIDTPVNKFKKIDPKKTHISDDSNDDEATPIVGNLKVRTDMFLNTPINGSFIKSNKNRNSINDEDEMVPVEDIANISSKLEKSRISDEFRLENKRFLSSTLADFKNSTPKNPVTGKRLLNKSVDTPKIFKQIKENDTPRKVEQIILSSTDDSDKENEDIIDISSDEEYRLPKSSPTKVVKQPTLLQLFKKEVPENEEKDTFIQVSQKIYQEQCDKARRIQVEFQRASELLKKVNLEHLPDRGLSLKNRVKVLEESHLAEVMKLSNMKVAPQHDPPIAQKKILSWNEIKEGAGNVLPRTFGKQAMATITTERQLTVDRLQQLHGSLQTCPKGNDLAEAPKGLKVELMTHQKQALSWLMWREKQKPSGGILADDMGLGKTLTMISLMLKCNAEEKNLSESEDDDDEENSPRKKSKFNGGTLVVCPASLINQWSGELERRTKRGLASCEVYHGAKRETKPKRLASHDMVVTTYSIVNNESEKNGAVFKVKWRRIIIDEAHQIRNHKSQTSDAVCRLLGKSRWALTGTPVHNKELDMYALIKFLRCTPFDDLKVWKRWVGDKTTGGVDRLHTVISSLMLRRTKVELIENGLLNAMPERKWELIPVALSERERGVYSKILIFSRTLFAQFLHQRAEKNQDAADANYVGTATNSDAPNEEYFLMRQKLLRLNKLKDIKQHEILVLLLRLRQICNHPSLITSMLEEDGNVELLGNEDEEADKAAPLNLLDQLNKLTLTDESTSENANVAEGIGEEPMSLKDVAKTVLSPSDPVFSKTRMSSKIKVLVKLLKGKILESNDKAVIVSQWPSFLGLIGYHLKEEGLVFDQLDGKVPVHKRMEMVDRFNNPKDKMKVLMLSLTAGGVGLNLIGANHLILLDLHWNPQLESQAQDRIYRVGQEKPVFVYKFMATDTIEKRILDLQEKKLGMANSMLTGSSQVNKNKLTLQDLKMLFEM